MKQKLITLTLIITFLLGLGIFISADETSSTGKTTDKTKQKDSTIKADKTETKSDDKKEEEIKPPYGEQWYEEGDEELYKFNIYPVTPKEGITGGILIYYGNLIKPPFKVEIINSYVYVNGINLINNPSLNKYSKLLRKKLIKELTQFLTKNNIKPRTQDETMNEINEINTINEILKSRYQIIEKFKKANNNLPSALTTFQKYLDSNSKVLDYKISSLNSFSILTVYSIPGKYFEVDLIENDNRGNEESYKKSLKRKKQRWERYLKSGLTIYSGPIIRTLKTDDLVKVHQILMSNSNRKEKIKNIYSVVFPFFSIAKFLYYNFNSDEFIQFINIKGY